MNKGKIKDYTSKIKQSDHIYSYFQAEWFNLTIISITGIIYNIGMTAGPWFEGQLAQRLYDIMAGTKQSKDMVILALSYLFVILLVQTMRYAKRFYVRRFANNINRNMKHIIYNNLVHQSKQELSETNIGSLMTKAISDVETCAEGMRKFTTEIFDTGVVMFAYLVMLFTYDARLAALSCIFPPFAYLLAQSLKKQVTKSASEYKKSAGKLNNETLERISGALTYRVLGVEKERNEAYEVRLADYEKKGIRTGILETTTQPLYQIISMISVIFIVYYGSLNVLGKGWTTWDIALFTTFLSCFSKLALKSSKAAKLFNAVSKAKVSWERIKPLMKTNQQEEVLPIPIIQALQVNHLSFCYPNHAPILNTISFSACKGEIIGISGAIACGKSTLGKTFLCEYPYLGSIQMDGQELSSLSPSKRSSLLSYMGHDCELFSDTIEENILLGNEGNAEDYLRLVCMDKEVHEMNEGILTKIGNGGVRLSGGQQARIALARLLAHQKPLLILDDPFSALDRKTEIQVFEKLRDFAQDSIILFISHRLYLFPQFDRIIWLEDGCGTLGTHQELLETKDEYREMYMTQIGDEQNA